MNQEGGGAKNMTSNLIYTPDLKPSKGTTIMYLQNFLVPWMVKQH